jgi:hypothetical protein
MVLGIYYAHWMESVILCPNLCTHCAYISVFLNIFFLLKKKNQTWITYKVLIAFVTISCAGHSVSSDKCIL